MLCKRSMSKRMKGRTEKKCKFNSYKIGKWLCSKVYQLLCQLLIKTKARHQHATLNQMRLFMIKVIILRYYNQCSVIKDAFTVIRKVYFKSTILVCSTGINNFYITHDCSANNALKIFSFTTLPSYSYSEVDMLFVYLSSLVYSINKLHFYI